MVNTRLTEAQRQLAEQHLPLVHYIIRRYFPHVRFSDYEDYAQIGAIGLCKAISRYDPSKSKLSTYACWCIRSALHDYERDARAACRDVRKEVCRVEDLPIGCTLASCETVETMTMADEILTFIHHLPLQDRQIICLRIAGYSQRHISQHMQLSQGWVSKRMSAIQQRLRREVGV